MIRNIDNCPYSEKQGEYGGASGLKDALLIDGENWIVKYPKNAEYLNNHEELKYTTDPLSEYLGSHIYKILGFPVHKTMLAERKGKIVVACKDFCKENERLVEIRTLKNSANNDLAEKLERDFSSTGSKHVVNFEEIRLHLQYNQILNKILHILTRFYDQIVVDAFINNSDRNNGNWGILRSSGHPDKLSPVYDNGGSFNGKTPDSRLKRMLENNQIKSQVLNSVSIYGKDDKNYLLRDILMFDIPELHDSLIRLVPEIERKLPECIELINNVEEEVCSDVRKEFYIKTLEARLQYLLIPAYENALKRKEEKSNNKLKNKNENQTDLKDVAPNNSTDSTDTKAFSPLDFVM